MVTKYLLTLHREWVVETSLDLNEDAIFDLTVGEFLNTDLGDLVDVLRLDDDDEESDTYEPDYIVTELDIKGRQRA